jgi:hypothetical protein
LGITRGAAFLPSTGRVSLAHRGAPDLNPIEQAFAKLKAMLGNAVTRTRDALSRSAHQQPQRRVLAGTHVRPAL